MPFLLRAAARRRSVWAGLAPLGTLPLAASAQTRPDAPATDNPVLDWRQAHDAVGRFLRGHLDLIKTEPAHPATAAPDGPVLDLDTARQWALAQRAELFGQADSGPAQALTLQRERQARHRPGAQAGRRHTRPPLNPRLPMRTPTTTALVLALVGLAGAAQAHGPQAHPSAPVVKEQKPWGIAGDVRQARRTLTIEMGDDMRFKPDLIEVREGETVRLALHNRGKLLHELVIGTQDELDAHAAMMVKFPNMQHDEPYMAHVAAGQRGGIVWTFNRPGDFKFACLIAGHYQAGMVGTLRVVPANKERS